MVKRGKKRGALVQPNFDSIKRFYAVAPFTGAEHATLPPVYAGAYSRRAAMNAYHVVGSSRDQIVSDAMRTFSPSSCTQEVTNLFLEVAALVSLYYDTKEQLQTLPDI
ncbi:hypothetical protein ABB37_08352 [Leptomonas pyrrhocoris]|uniref:Uncharacterized protein n=1 Tax=Leptomonas pyrrhocoris TaxID=157538 RepID=A0A0M9FTM6_LEPPY|nr:hypothetical protein ABB37_08352 [Leptomonas pyrrhocoris]KPA75840.1 hypothetical protein ABB37_08352 [Leptomonas pyrrhocoris]|eukprot:XP_015654279.1 hypothetical protein ABB37_08352 [Leptomonas pyrrhocoris]